MTANHTDHDPRNGTDASRLRQKGLRVTAPRLAIMGMLQQVGGHKSADELVLALRSSGYHHARTTVYNALDDLARAGLIRSAPVDSGALRYETNSVAHHHFVCRECSVIIDIPVAPDLASRPLPTIEGAEADELDVVYRGRCDACASATTAGPATGVMSSSATSEPDVAERSEGQATVALSTSDGEGPSPSADRESPFARVH